MKSKVVVWVVECKSKTFRPIDGWMFVSKRDATEYAKRVTENNGFEYRVSKYVREEKV